MNKSKFVETLLSICKQGCIITKINPELWDDYRKERECISTFFPKQMIPDDSQDSMYSTHSFTIKGIGVGDDVRIYCDIYFKYYYMYWNVTGHSRKYFSTEDPQSISQLMHYAYTLNIIQSPEIITEPHILTQLEMYKKNLWNFMYDKCFITMGLLYLTICDKYLIPDVKKLIINNILMEEKWTHLGFYCV